MSEEFIEYEGEASPGAGSSRAFGIAAGILATILILSLACAGVAWSQRGGGDGDGTAEVNQEVAAIETQNAIIAVTNEAVTATIIAMETEAAQPTNTPPPPTNTPAPTSTPVPTNTPVVQPAEDEDGDADGEDGTAGGDVGEAMINTPTPIPGLGSGSSGTGTTTGTGTTAGDTGSAALPETGLEIWAAVLLAFVLIAVFFAARRLRAQ